MKVDMVSKTAVDFSAQVHPFNVCTVLAPSARDMTHLYLQKSVLIAIYIMWLLSGPTVLVFHVNLSTDDICWLTDRGRQKQTRLVVSKKLVYIFYCFNCIVVRCT